MIYNRLLRMIADILPYTRALESKIKMLESKMSESFVPPGHFYSPINDLNEILECDKKIFDRNRSLNGIALNKTGQFRLLEEFKNYYDLLFFPEKPNETKRYYYENENYSYSDVIILFSMIMHNKPKKIIEIGSGFSSTAMLDINEKYFNNSIDITFIEPFPEKLKKLVKPSDKYTLIEKKVQSVDLSVFKSLTENDILFIDSSHVAKTNSDVLFEIFDILPSLNKGVKIHFHDIFYPFEYPRDWIIDEKRCWNEIYFLQSFLMYNSAFKILMLNTYLEEEYTQWFENNMPLCLKNLGGSCWLEKVQ